MPAWSHDVADALAEGRVAVVRDAFAPALVAALRAQALQRDDAGALRPAGVGRGAAHVMAESIRGDRIAWLDDATTNDAERAYLATMHALAQALNRDLMLGLASLEAHYAIYPPGAGYARHRDRFRDDDARVLSCILYLNDAVAAHRRRCAARALGRWAAAGCAARGRHARAVRRGPVRARGAARVATAHRAHRLVPPPHAVNPVTRSNDSECLLRVTGRG